LSCELCLPEPQGDRCANELEHSALGGGGLGELVEGDACAGDATGASGDRFEVFEQSLVGVDRLVCGGLLGGGFRLG